MRSVNRAPAAAAAAAAATTAIVEESMSSAPPCVVDINTDTNNNNNRFDAIYVRVSTNEQSEELDRQLATLQHKYPNARVFRDVASGMNFRRPALRALLGHAFAGRVQHVYVADRERLCRFAYELIEFVLQSHGCDIVVESHAANVDHNKELADDIVSTVTVFAAHLYGARGGKRPREHDISSEETAQRAGRGKSRLSVEEVDVS